PLTSPILHTFPTRRSSDLILASNGHNSNFLRLNNGSANQTRAKHLQERVPNLPSTHVHCDSWWLSSLSTLHFPGLLVRRLLKSPKDGQNARLHALHRLPPDSPESPEWLPPYQLPPQLCPSWHDAVSP